MPAMLEVQSLQVSYGAIRAIQDVSLTVNQGEIVTLIGGNGAGKTTTLRSLTKMAPHDIVRLGIAQSPEGRGIFANMSVEENIELGAYARGSGESAQIRADREKGLTLFPRLRERLKQNAGTLSGGEQQMLAIARALMARPRLLLLDEPSLGLAPQIVQTIFKIIRDINQTGTTILLVEQNAHQALKVAHRAYVLEVGRIVLEGDAKKLAESDDVRKAYLGVG
jgi:branched-chain amino acid transport system ATP-binding protein